jgi:hypothetical protein
MLDPDDFVLSGGDGRYVGTVAPGWCFDGRAFGGFSASLALAAIARHAGRPVFTSAAVAFLEPCGAGEVHLDVTTLRAGRNTAVAQAVLRQSAGPVLTATAVLADAWIEPSTIAAAPPFADAPFVPPVDGDPLDWLVETWPMLGFAERRGVDYPSSFLTFRDREPKAALWMRLLEDAGAEPDPSSAWLPQLADVLHLDAHLFDAPGMITGFTDPEVPNDTGAWMLSLDLAIAWQPGAAAVPAGAWRLLETRGSVVERGVTSYGSLRGEDGALLAVATSQGLLRH